MIIVEIASDNGLAPVRFEVADVPDVADGDAEDVWAGVESRARVVKQVAKAGVSVTRQIYTEAIDMACAMATQTHQRISAMDKAARPDEFELTFALSIDTAIGAKVVNLGSDAQVKVRMQWNRRAGD